MKLSKAMAAAGSSGDRSHPWITLALQTRRVDYDALKNAAKGTEWMTVGQSYSEQRHSTLTQINASNLSQLGMAWSYDVGPGGGKQETTPLFANGILYGVTNWSIAFAVDARTGTAPPAAPPNNSPKLYAFN